MAVSSQHLAPPHCGSPALQEQNWGPLLLSCCANDLGSSLQSLLFLLKASSSSGGETEKVSLERDSHWQGLDLLRFVFALSKIALLAANGDG